MSECDVRLIPSGEEQCDVALIPVSEPQPIECVRNLPWSESPVFIPRSCFTQGMTDSEAQNYTFTLINALHADEVAVFDQYGNLTFTPSATIQEPPECSTSSRVLQVRADNGEP